MCDSFDHISDIKPIKIDITLDFSQKTKKGILTIDFINLFYSRNNKFQLSPKKSVHSNMILSSLKSELLNFGLKIILSKEEHEL